MLSGKEVVSIDIFWVYTQFYEKQTIWEQNNSMETTRELQNYNSVNANLFSFKQGNM